MFTQKKLFGFILTVALVMGLGALVSCKKQDTSRKDTIVYSYMSNVGPLNPHMYSPNQMFAQAMVYDTLVKLNDDGSIGGSLAESWDISADGKVYTFHLRSGVTFSDGEPFNAAAVEQNFKAIMGNAGRHAWLGITDKIEKYEAVSTLEFRLTLNAAYYPCLDDLALPRPFTFLSPKAFPLDGDTSKGIKAAIGTGAWKLVETALGEYDLFERNDTYWGGKAGPAEVLVKVIPDPVTRALAFESGDIDIIYGQGQVNYDTFNRLKNSDGVEAKISGPRGTVNVALNSAKGPTQEIAVRRAIQHLSNKPEIVKGVTLGTQIKADFYFSPTVPYCNVGLEPYAYNRETAAVLLDEADWKLPAGKKIREKNGAPLEIDFCFVGNNAAQKAIAEVLQGQALAVGVSLKLLGEEEDSFYRRQKEGDFGMIFSDTWGPPYEPHAMVSSMLLPSHADYMAQIGLPMKNELDSTIRKVFVTTNVDERAALYKNIISTLHEQAVYLPIYHMTMFEVHRSKELKNVRFGTTKSDIPFAAIGLE
ncbi:nickel ABC transporter, nickel/metallophore periplasmic binding protein [Spirochaetia bacterium]|nr:nickel ABC transporter, nickel/metallophore periplasmic binding protein [Spirochaetia bacterium]